MSPCAPRLASSARGFPRVSGDEPTIETAADLADLFSPRERG